MKNIKKNLFNKDLLSYVKKNIEIFVMYVAKHYFISIFFLICFSPIFSLIWLCLPSLYFLYKRNYKNFFNIWAFTLFLWHSIFTFIFLDFGPIIIIGEGHTKNLLDYLLLNDETFWFTGLCYQTIYIFDALSQKMGFLICIPIIFPIKKNYKKN
jgi:hypothetical protein